MRKELANSMAISLMVFSSACSKPNPTIDTNIEPLASPSAEPSPTNTSMELVPSPTTEPTPTANQTLVELDGKCFIHPVAGPVMGVSGFSEEHTAADFGVNKIGYEALSSIDGKIAYAEAISGYGLLVIVETPSEDGSFIQTRYAHLDEISVEVGDKVEQGEPLGIIGSTGRSSGPHLHFEVLKTNWPFDWLSFQLIWVAAPLTFDAYDEMERKHGPEEIEWFNPVELIKENC